MLRGHIRRAAPAGPDHDHKQHAAALQCQSRSHDHDQSRNASESDGATLDRNGGWCVVLLVLLFHNSEHTSYFINYLRHFPDAEVYANAWQFAKPARTVGGDVVDLQDAGQRCKLERLAELGLELIDVPHGFQECLVWPGRPQMLHVDDLFAHVDQLGAPPSWSVGVGTSLMWVMERMLLIPHYESKLAIQCYCRTMHWKDHACNEVVLTPSPRAHEPI